MKKASALLCIDAGNTSVKWCVHPNALQAFANPEELFSHPTAAFKPFADSSALLQSQLGPVLNGAGNQITAVLLSNVLGPDFELALRSLCHQHALPLHVLAVDAHAQVQSAYENPAALGKDRWAACLAVTQVSNSPVNLLVSFGTATTLDAVVKKGGWQHPGGFIVPGVLTMFDSLHLNTAELPHVELGKRADLPQNGWPVNTLQAIGEGVGRLQGALVQSLAAQLEQQHGQFPAVWFCGGFAGQMLTYFPQAYLLEHAVFKGLVLDYQLARQGSSA